LDALVSLREQLQTGAADPHWPQLPGPYRRLLDAARGLAPGQTGPADIIGLTHQVLRREALRQGADPALTLPLGTPWPSLEVWRLHGFEVLPGDQKVTVFARPWTPTWLERGADPAEPATATMRRHRGRPVPADPFFTELRGVATYRTVGQQSAARAVVSSPPGATTVVNLPTGSGKSAVAIVPALLRPAVGRVTIVVVPTVTLALDQERAVQADYAPRFLGLPDRLAYVSAMAAAERQAIRARIRDGSQQIVFTSPESLVGSLRTAVYRAAEVGRLHMLVIDEVHLVSQWGDEFRPQFQAIAGLRQDLLRVAEANGHRPFRTVLMTATLTEQSLSTLEVLFGRPGPFVQVSSVVIRPEPAYWVVRCTDEAERRARLLDAVAHLPRPLILYTTRVADAAAWEAQLRAAGYRRAALVTGESSGQQRQDAIAQLRGEWPDAAGSPSTRADIVVATSAFGLGVDQADVRSVLHACVPETIDRFYQEVGRGGRDGNASIALTLYTERDLELARGLNRKTLISVERGVERWQAMLERAQHLADGRLRVDLRSRPADLDQDSAENQAWNLRTLALMARAGVLILEAEPPPRQSEREAEAADETGQAADLRITTVAVRVVVGNLAERSVWEKVVGEARNRTRDAAQRDLALMFDILQDDRCCGEICTDAYRIQAYQSVAGDAVDVRPQPSCGGCAACRRLGRDPYEGLAPVPEQPAARSRALGPDLARLLAGASTITVLCPPLDSSDVRRWVRSVRPLVEACVRNGVTRLVAPDVLLDDTRIRDLHQRTDGGFLFVDHDPLPIGRPRVPTLILHDPRQRAPMLDTALYERSDRAEPFIVVVPADARDPERPHVDLADLRFPNLVLDEFVRRL
jgi:superfamily II DNA helicase RecQ